MSFAGCKRSLRSSSRPSLLKIMDAACLSDHFGVSLSSSESSDLEFTPAYTKGCSGNIL